MTRGTIGLYLSEIVDREDCPFVLTADLAVPLGLTEFANKRPERFLDVGIAEQCLVAAAAGCASTGLPAIAVTFASFALRGLEAFRNAVLYEKAHVILIGSHAGIATGANGPTHQSTEDLAVFSSLENVMCFSPRSVSEAVAELHLAIKEPGQYYCRLARWSPSRREEAHGVETSPKDVPWSSLYQCESDAPRVMLFTHGITWNIACDVVDGLFELGIAACAMHFGRFPLELPTVPLTVEMVVTIEDHYAQSGLGGITESNLGKQVSVIQIGSSWPLGSDEAALLFDAIGMTTEHIIAKIESQLQ